ncbi:MAG: hypothetical protein AAF806_18875 [Bacteroidota bacterium]
MNKTKVKTYLLTTNQFGRKFEHPVFKINFRDGNTIAVHAIGIHHGAYYNEARRCYKRHQESIKASFLAIDRHCRTDRK